MKNQIEQAVQVLNDGGIIIFPTDTAYGIGCRMDYEKAVNRLFKVRKRPENQATPVLVSSFEMAQEYLLPIPHDVEELLMAKYWPGALTIILPCKTEKVLGLVRGGGNTLGVRMPNHPVVLEIIKRVVVPILGPSANFHGEPTSYKFDDLDIELVSQVDFIVKGECKLKSASTVIDCSIEPWKVLREGAIEVQKSPPKADQPLAEKVKSLLLIIDTSSNMEVKVGLKIDNKEILIKQSLDRRKAQAVLPLVEEVLKKNKLELTDLTGIEVNPGPGSFTGLRIGIAIANTLGFLLKIPVNGKTMVEPEY